MTPGRTLAAALLALAALAATHVPSSAQAPNSPERIAAILAAPERSAADRTNDIRRKPADMLAFIGIRPGITALDLSAAGGYSTELVSRSIGPSGQVYGQSPPRNPAAVRPAAPEGNSNPSLPAAPPPAGPFRPSPEALAARVKTMTDAGASFAPITAIVRPFEDPLPPDLAEGKFDLVTLIFNYHDLGHMGVDRSAMNAAAFKALKPGGIFVIADHSGRPGTGISEAGTLHRIEEAFLRREVEAAGFRLIAEGNFLRNPADPRDKNTPDPPMPKDEFVLKFQRP